MTRVFIDGSAGTTGLRIHERLAGRKDIELIILPEEKRKEEASIREALHEADIAFLCLPDAAAVEAVKLAEESGVKLIDTSTAHRTADGWTYGFPEIGDLREKIASSDRIANPGCHASGFVVLIAPLVEAGLISKDTALSCISLTGYSGGGKKMIADYEAADRDPLLKAPRVYGLTQTHKHLKEMKKIADLNAEPAFYPIVADFYSGMETNIAIFKKDLKGSIDDIRELYKEKYNSRIVHYEETVDDGGFISAAKLSGRDDMVVSVAGNEDRISLIALFDNLGKGASGAAIQNMNIIMGVDETTGLTL